MARPEMMRQSQQISYPQIVLEVLSHSLLYPYMLYSQQEEQECCPFPYRRSSLFRRVTMSGQAKERLSTANQKLATMIIWVSETK